MPKIETWARLPPSVRQHLIDRMRDRAISIGDLNHLRLWIDSNPEVPEGDWYKDFGSFTICGNGSLPQTSLRRGAAAQGPGVKPSWIPTLLPPIATAAGPSTGGLVTPSRLPSTEPTTRM